MKSFAFFAAVITALSSFAPALAHIYSLSNEIVGPGFYSAFVWEAIADPTQGRVYVMRNVIYGWPTFWYHPGLMSTRASLGIKISLSPRLIPLFCELIFILSWMPTAQDGTLSVSGRRTHIPPMLLCALRMILFLCLISAHKRCAFTALMFVICLKDVGGWSERHEWLDKVLRLSRTWPAIWETKGSNWPTGVRHCLLQWLLIRIDIL